MNGSITKEEQTMPCVLAVAALMLPRVVMFFIWVLTNWFTASFATVIWPLLGFFFMPYTTLAYMATMLNNDHVISGWWLALIIVAAVVDAGHWGGGGRVFHRRHVVVG
jgi:hypothetical protein